MRSEYHTKRGRRLFSRQFWYMGVLTVFVVTLEVIVAIYASKRKRLRETLLFCIATFVLAYETASFIRTHDMPIAFSTFSYFLLAFAVFVPWHPLKSVAAFCAFVSGVVYLSAFVFYPDPIYANQLAEGERIVGFLLHNLLLFGSLLLLGQFKLEEVDVFYLLGAIIFVVVYVEVVVHICASAQVNFLTIGIIEGTLFQHMVPNSVGKWWWYVAWYALIDVIFVAIWRLLNLINQRLLRQ